MWIQWVKVLRSRPILGNQPWIFIERTDAEAEAPTFWPPDVHWVGDAIQPSHPLSSPSSPTFNLSQHQGLFKWVSSSHQVARILYYILSQKLSILFLVEIFYLFLKCFLIYWGYQDMCVNWQVNNWSSPSNSELLRGSEY